MNEWEEFDPVDAAELLRSAAAEAKEANQYRRSVAGGIFGPNYDREVILAGSAYRCGICGGQLEEIQHRGQASGRYRFQIDHILPLVLGGTDTYDNLQPAHDYCNQSKAGRFLAACELPAGSSSEHLREKRRRRKRGADQSHAEYLRVIGQLGLNEYLARFIEAADGWQALSYDDRTVRWMDRLAEIGPASQDAMDYAASMPEMGLKYRDGVYCGTLIEDAYWASHYHWHPDELEPDRTGQHGGFRPGESYGEWYNSIWGTPENAIQRSAVEVRRAILDDYLQRTEVRRAVLDEYVRRRTSRPSDKP